MIDVLLAPTTPTKEHDTGPLPAAQDGKTCAVPECDRPATTRKCCRCYRSLCYIHARDAFCPACEGRTV